VDANLIIETREFVDKDEELVISYGLELDRTQSSQYVRKKCKEQIKQNFLFECNCDI